MAKVKDNVDEKCLEKLTMEMNDEIQAYLNQNGIKPNSFLNMTGDNQ